MKLTIEDDKTETTVRFWVEKHGELVLLMATDGGIHKALIKFLGDGRAIRIGSANVGDFNFDKQGRLIIE